MDSLDNSIWTVEVGILCKHNEKSKHKYGMIQKTVTKAKRVRNHITDQKSGKISNQSHNRWRSALSLAVAGRRAMEKFATLS